VSLDPAGLLAIAEPVAREVAEHLRTSLAGAGPTISTKSTPTDLVTDLDVWAERRIVEHLRAARPDDGIEGEEGASIDGTSGVTWSIDPIDGTVNFVHGLPGFNVSIAALVDDDAVAGVVASPLTHEVFTAVRGEGARCNDRPIRCATPGSLGRAIVATGFAYDPDRRTRQAEVVARTIGSIADIRRFGAAATDLCWVGAGRTDAYWEVGLNRWDLSAGGLVASEAGARVGDLDGGPPSGRFVLAAAPTIWDELADVLRSAGADRV
jgi:myo-inositol-1(or 4)-monophosphatase